MRYSWLTASDAGAVAAAIDWLVDGTDVADAPPHIVKRKRKREKKGEERKREKKEKDKKNKDKEKK